MDQQTAETRQKLKARLPILEDRIRTFRQPLDLGSGKETVDGSVQNEVNEERLRELTLTQAELMTTQQILLRIEAGTYGICRWCDEPIPEARLKCAAADTTICVECAEKLSAQIFPRKTATFRKR